MRLLHLSDLHLGKNLNEFSLIEDQRYILNRILEIIAEKEIEAVLIAGDIFDKSVPSEEAVRLFDTFLTELAALNRNVFIVSGNHDSDERLNYGSRLFMAKNIYINGKYNGDIPCYTLEDDYGPVNFYLMPYVKASRVSHFYPEEEIKSYDQAFRVAIEKSNVNTEERNVILTHQFVTGTSDPELSGSEVSILNIGNIDKIGADAFDDFDYVAMGHIHSAQCVGRDTCRYSGSPLKYSIGERDIKDEKTVPVITLNEKGNTEIELIPLKPLHNVRHIKGKLAELIAHAEDREDFVYATLTDEDNQHEAMARLQEVYPRTVKLDYDNARTRALHEDGMDLEVEGKSFDELITDFYKMINGTDISEEEMDILMDVAEEAGVRE